MFHKQKDRFSIRKFKIGVGSVFLGSFLLVAPQVYAEETANGIPGSELITKQAEPKPADLTEKTPSVEEPSQLTEENAASTQPMKETLQSVPEVNPTSPVAAQPAEVEKTEEVEEVAPVAEVPAKASETSKTVAEVKQPDNYQGTNEATSTKEVKEQLINTNQIGASFRSVGSDRSVSDNKATQPFELGNAEYNAKARLEVTKKNMVSYFTVGGDAKGDDVNPTTLTADVSGQRGSLGLFNKINMNEDFRLEGKLNLGNKYEGYQVDGKSGGDGVSVVFTTANPGDVGQSGASIGLGGIPNSFGFKLDTWHNTSTPNAAQKAGADPRFLGWQNGAFGAFYSTNGAGVASTAAADVKKLNNPPMNNEFKDLVVSYNGSTKVMTVTYDGQTFSRNIQDYLNRTRTTTRQKAGEEELAFAIFASTGAGTNLQQFDLTRFEYSTGGNYIKVLYKDDATGETIKEVIYSGTTRETLNLSDKLSLPNYVMKRTNADTAEGYQDSNTIAFKTGIQTITYTYEKVDKEQLKKLIDGDEPLKETATYTTADKEAQDAYNNAIDEGKKVLANSSADQATVDASSNKITEAIAGLKAAAAEAKALQDAQDAVAKAEEAQKDAQAKLDEIKQTPGVSQEEVDALTALNEKVTEAKAKADELVKALDNDVAEKPGLQDRVDAVHPLEVPEVDTDGDGKTDAAEAKALQDAQDAVAKAEEAQKDAQAKLDEIKQTPGVSQEEVDALTALNEKVTEAKAKADELVKALDNDVAEKPGLQDRVDAVHPLEVPEVDTDGDGKTDAAEAKALQDAQDAVAKAEEA
ncbi:lectin-like domain-containing protein, partial [Streptococcus jiangjianxini]|uniref:lectin-like domain-containing protein n=1 Tax=Streptococcus jiangjianxini TaxID=3161189 RepID=UPI0032EF11BE